MRALSSSCCILLVAVAGSQQSQNLNLLLTKTKAIALLSPSQVAPGTARTFKWSPDGKYLAVSSSDEKQLANVAAMLSQSKEMPPAMPESLLTVYTLEKGTATTILKTPMLQSQVGDFEWLPGSTNLVVNLYVPTLDPETKRSTGITSRTIVLSAINGKQVSSINTGTEEADVKFHTAPEAFGVVVEVLSQQLEGIDHRYILIGPDGRARGTIRGDGRPAEKFLWHKAAQRIYLTGQVRINEKFADRYALMDFENGNSMVVAKPNIPAETKPELEYSLVKGSTQSKESENIANLSAAWIVAKDKGENSSALVASDVDVMSLAPLGNAVFYTTKGVATIRLLASLPKELALNAMQAALRTKILSDCKQVGLALMMYGADNDDMLPSASGDWANAIGPYLRNNSIMDGFVYTFGGGNMADVKDRASTELGYKIGPGGRAVTYADGHVKWIPDK